MGINLYMETSKGIISIPFVSIKEADLFTSQYNSRFDNVGNRNNLLNVYNKYEELNYILNSDKIEKTLYIIKEKENINL